MKINSYIFGFPLPLKAFLSTKLLAYMQSAFAQFLINIYFWRITQDIKVLVTFNVVFTLAHFAAFVVAAKISKEHSVSTPLQVGTVLQIGYLLLILLLHDSITSYVIFVAFVGGIAHGAYWLSDNLLKFDLTNPGNRLQFTGAYQSVKHIAGAIVPFVASLLVFSDGSVFHSYSKVFIAAIICALAVLVSSFLVLQKGSTAKSKFSILNIQKKLWKDPNIRIANISTFLGQVASVMPVILGLLLFIQSGTELSLGSYQLMMVLLAVFSNYYMGKFFSRKHYRKLLIFGGILNFLFILILLVNQSHTAILLYGILTSLCSFMGAPHYPMVQDTLTMHCKDDIERTEIRVEYMVLQECADSFGKIIGFLLLLFAGTFANVSTLGGIIFLCGLFALSSAILITRTKDCFPSTV